MGSLVMGCLRSDVCDVVGSMTISVELPVMIRLDNVDAIFMASIITTMSHTKHIYIRYKV